MKIVVLTGSGISAESGIPTFRATDGLWENFSPKDVATPEGFERNPQLVLDFYNARRKDILKAQPNAAHEWLAKLEEKHEVIILTQNIDDLHERAGSTNVIHLHGEIMKAYHKDNFSDVRPYHEDLTVESGLRPDVVWFGEGVLRFTEAEEHTREADLFVTIGTTLEVFPVAGLYMTAPYDVPRVVIDPVLPHLATMNPLIEDVYHIAEPATVGVEKLCQQLLKDSHLD